MDQYIDSGLLIIICSVLFSLLFMKILFKFVSMPRVIKCLIVIAFIALNGFLIYNYIEQNEKNYIDEKAHYYITGVVVNSTTSINKVKISVVNKNMSIPDDLDFVIVNATKSTPVRQKIDGKYDVIAFSDIKPGDTITVYCKKNKIAKGENEIDAVKVIRTSK